MIIYKIENKLNGKVYIGQTIRSFEERINEHKRKHKRGIGQAIDKYGEENFTYEIIDYADSENSLNELEIYYIQYFNSLVPNGYNLCLGGGNTSGYHHTEESKSKMSKSQKGKWEKENNPFYGKHHSEEQKAKWSKQRKGRDMSKARESSIEKNRKKVINLDTLQVFNSIKEAGEFYNIASTHITRVCKGKRKTCKGYHFMYYEEYKQKYMTIPCQAY